jgi:Reverse transcriptase (RNA-dependent DNA polymerase)
MQPRCIWPKTTQDRHTSSSETGIKPEESNHQIPHHQKWRICILNTRTCIQIPPTQMPIQTYVTYDINDTAPKEDEIVKALFKMKLRKTPGALGITIDDIKKWYHKARVAEDRTEEDIIIWEKVVTIITLAFTTGNIPSSFYNAILVLVPTPGNKGFRGIALLVTIYKIMSMIIHRRLTSTINLHESIHGFCTQRGTGTAITNIKLLMQSIQRDINPMYMIFLDMKKAYDSVDRERILQLLQQYGVGPNICNIIEQIWRNDKLIPKQNKFFGTPIFATRGVRQGEIMSPKLFNIMIDAVIRDYEERARIDNKTLIQFYADNGFIGSPDYVVAQYTLNVLGQSFQSFGLNINDEKTESMTMVGCRAVHRISDGAHNRMITRQGPTNAEIKKIMTKCTNCGVEVQNASLKKHILSKRCLNHKADFNQQDMVCIPIIETTTDTFVISIYGDNNTQCTHQGCPYTTTKRERMRKHLGLGIRKT